MPMRTMLTQYLAMLWMLPVSTLPCMTVTWGEHVKEPPTSRDERAPSPQARSYPPATVATCECPSNQ